MQMYEWVESTNTVMVISDGEYSDMCVNTYVYQEHIPVVFNFTDL